MRSLKRKYEIRTFRSIYLPGHFIQETDRFVLVDATRFDEAFLVGAGVLRV
jgi:hypothetical protein